MGLRVGLWMDHRQAIIVKLDDHEERIERIQSLAEKQLRRSGESPLKGPFDVLHVPADTVRQRTFTVQMNAYYDEIIEYIRAADAVLIMGPGEARHELRKRMQKSALAERAVAVEKAGWMTERQIAARVRRYFKEKNEL